MIWSCFKEIVEVTSQITTTVIAGFGAWVAYQTLLRTPTQEPEPEFAETTDEDLKEIYEAAVFSTSHQTTKLVVTNNGLECHLRDYRPYKRSGLMWTLSRDQAREILAKRDFRIYPSYKLYSGTFSIGPRRNWLYSKKLYPEPSLLEFELEKLLTNAST